MAGDERRRPTICLNMIVRNEAHIIHQLIASVAAHIDSWVIVDTGSTDGTQDLIRRLMAERGIPGELFERSWRNFGSNRTEALELAQGRGDYIWVMDADDVVTGAIDFSGLTADGYSVRIDDGTVYWRVQLFRDGVPWRYAGVLHEVAVCDVPHTKQRLEGDYRIESRRLGARNQDPQKYVRDAAILQAEVDRNPHDTRSVFYLAQSYFDAGDFAAARRWYDRRAAMGGWQEEVYYSLYRVALAMEHGGESWPNVQDAFLRAWSYRPIRAEPLYLIARHYRVAGDYRLGHLFAEQAARLSLPKGDVLFVPADVYEWRALDEQAVCASWIGRQAEAFGIYQRLLARTDIPAEDRARITANRDLAAKTLSEVTVSRSDATAPSATPDAALRQALARRLQVRSTASGRIRMPAVPALLDECQANCLRFFAALGVDFTPEQTARLREVLAGQLTAAYAASPRSEILVTYDAPVGRQVNWTVKPEWVSVQAAYDNWVATRKPPFFGTAPDARVWSLVNGASEPRSCPVLDIGAGTGRNALAIAHRGHPVDAIEMSSQFAALLRDEAARESLPVRVIERDLFAGAGDLRSDYGLVVLSEVVSDFRDTGQLRQMFELAAACLAPGGRLVFNIFLPRVGYVPDDAARQLGQQVYTSIFTYPEVAAAAAGLPLELVADDSAHDYERQHLPEGAWPPTGWYADWASGRDVFDLPRDESPIELRWLVYQSEKGSSHQR